MCVRWTRLQSPEGFVRHGFLVGSEIVESRFKLNSTWVLGKYKIGGPRGKRYKKKTIFTKEV